MTDMTVANTILAQLGGRKFIAMTGSKNFVGDDKSLKFNIPTTRKINTVVVQLCENDLYRVCFHKFNKSKLQLELISVSDQIGCEQLQEVFTRTTGLYTRL